MTYGIEDIQNHINQKYLKLGTLEWSESVQGLWKQAEKINTNESSENTSYIKAVATAHWIRIGVVKRWDHSEGGWDESISECRFKSLIVMCGVLMILAHNRSNFLDWWCFDSGIINSFVFSQPRILVNILSSIGVPFHLCSFFYSSTFITSIFCCDNISNMNIHMFLKLVTLWIDKWLGAVVRILRCPHKTSPYIIELLLYLRHTKVRNSQFDESALHVVLQDLLLSKVLGLRRLYFFRCSLLWECWRDEREIRWH